MAEETCDEELRYVEDDYAMVRAGSFDTIYEGRLDDEFEKFDIQGAKDYLRQYTVKLQSDRKRKKKHQFISRFSVNHSNQNDRHFEHLYEMGKAKVRSERDDKCTSRMDTSLFKTDSNPSSTNEIINRLYERSRMMQTSGKQRREEIDRLRELSNLLPQDRPALNKKIYSIHSLRSPNSLAKRKTVDRLYSRSMSMQIMGRQRRNKIHNKISSRPPRFNLKSSDWASPKEIDEQPIHRTDLNNTLSPREVMDRLYERSARARVIGRERREEIQVRSQSQPRARPNSLNTQSQSPVTYSYEKKSNSSPSPQEIMNRLYCRSENDQKSGKERREQIKARSQFDQDQRMIYNVKPSPPPNPIHNKSTQRGSKDLSNPFSSFLVTERLYGRSLRHQQMGRERREGIDKVRALSNARSPINMSGSPVPSKSSASAVISSGVHEHRSPEEVSNRLYGRAEKLRQDGRHRRNKVLQMRCTSLPRLSLHRHSPSPAEYSRSVYSKAAGKDASVVSDRKDHRKSTGAIKVRESSPAPGPAGRTMSSVPVAE